MSDYIDYSEPMLAVKAMLRTLDGLLLEGKIDEAMELIPEVITEMRMMQSTLAVMSGK